MTLWNVTYIPADFGGATGAAFEQGYQGYSRVLAWLNVQRLRSLGNDVEVWVRKPGTIKQVRYAMYPAFTWTVP